MKPPPKEFVDWLMTVVVVLFVLLAATWLAQEWGIL
jgi:hypothetical protein